MATFENTVMIARPIKDVFAFLSDVENIPKWNYAIVETRKAEAVKPGETSFGYLVCMRASGVGWLIQATVGSFGGVGGRANRAGWSA